MKHFWSKCTRLDGRMDYGKHLENYKEWGI